MTLNDLDPNFAALADIRSVCDDLNVACMYKKQQFFIYQK